MQQYRLQIAVLFLFDPISVMDNFAFVTAKKDLDQQALKTCILMKSVKESIVFCLVFGQYIFFIFDQDIFVFSLLSLLTYSQ